MRRAFAHQATVSMERDADPAALGAAVTVALCGHWDHPPPCPLAPHYTSTARDGDVVRVRTLFACEPDQENLVRERIHTALQAGATGDVVWVLRGSARDEVREAEHSHADRLLQS